MNFVEAAIALLEEAGKPLHVEQLCELAMERGLLDRPGTSPLRSMKGRLTTELHRGDESRLVKLEGDLWTLRDGVTATEAVAGDHAAKDVAESYEPDELEEEAAAFAEAGLAPTPAFDDDDDDDDIDDEEAEDLEEAEEDDDEHEDADAYLADELAISASEDDDDVEDGAAADRDFADDSVEAIESPPSEPAESIGPPSVEGGPEGRRRRRRRRRRRGRERGGFGTENGMTSGQPPSATAEHGGASADSVPEADDLEEDDFDETPDVELSPQTPEEEEFARVYAGELGGTTPVGQVAEYRDQRTSDEDRLLLPEIKADRRGHLRSRREERKSRRDRERAAREERRRERPAYASDQRETADRAGGPGAVATTAPRGLADLAYSALSSLNNGQAVNVNQLAQMMRKRNIVTGDPNILAPLLKAALVGDANARLERGLRPRVEYRGRGTFSARLPVLDEATRRAEAGLADAIARLEVSTRAALKARLPRLGQLGLERLVHLYLERTGWRDLDWIKRVGPSSYAIGKPAFREEAWLVGVRAGTEPVDRRGVGELRAGVEAKGLAGGLLFSPQDLSADARLEQSREGKPISAVCGEDFVSSLFTVGVGVVAATARVHYLDCDLLDELT
jgi:hypothetical protein